MSFRFEGSVHDATNTSRSRLARAIIVMIGAFTIASAGGCVSSVGASSGGGTSLTGRPNAELNGTQAAK